MVTRELIKIRDLGGERHPQSYQFGMSEKYLKYRRDPIGRYLRSILMDGVPEEFLNPNAESVSRSVKYVAVDEKTLEPIYRELKKSELIPFPVEHFGGSSHFLSKCALESQGFVDKRFVCKDGPTLQAGWSMHERTQRWFMNHGVAEAMEVPVWKSNDELVQDINDFSEVTGFIDILVRMGNRLWICDYKPDASSAKNKHAISQVLRYRDLLHLRTGLEDIGVAWFDERDAYLAKL